VAEAGLEVVRRDGGEGLAEAMVQGEEGSSLGRSQALLDLGPALLNRVEVGGVGRQIPEFGSGGLDEIANPVDFVSGQVIHDHYVAGPKLRTEHLFQISQKDLAIRSRFDGHGGDPTGAADRAQHSECAPVPARSAFGDACPARTTPVTPGHLRGHATFVQENQLFRIDPARFFAPEAAPDLALGGVLLGGVERLFFSRRSMAASTSHNRDRLL